MAPSRGTGASSAIEGADWASADSEHGSRSHEGPRPTRRTYYRPSGPCRGAGPETELAYASARLPLTALALAHERRARDRALDGAAVHRSYGGKTPWPPSVVSAHRRSSITACWRSTRPSAPTNDESRTTSPGPSRRVRRAVSLARW